MSALKERTLHKDNHQFVSWNNDNYVRIFIRDVEKKDNRGLKSVLEGNEWEYTLNDSISTTVNLSSIGHSNRLYDFNTSFESNYGKDVGVFMSDNRKSHIRKGVKLSNIDPLMKFSFSEFDDAIRKELAESYSIDFEDYVIVKKEKFDQLSKYEIAVEDAIDEIMLETAIERQNDEMELSLSDVINNLDLDANEILSLLNEIEDEG